jgi:hypothetical protein
MNAVKSNPINTREPIIVKAEEFNGVDRLDIRHYFFSDTDELSHTARGVNVRLDKAEALVMAVVQVVESYPAKLSKSIVVRSDDCPVVVEISEYMGVDRLDIRHYWTPKGGKKPVATRKGVNLPVDMASGFLTELTSIYLKSKVVEIAESQPAASQPQVEYILEQGAGDEEIVMPVPVSERRFTNVEI